LLHRHYPASSLLLPRPTPAMAAAFRDVEAATLTIDGSPLMTTNHLSNVRAHYPGGSSGCAYRLLPTLVGVFPKWQEGRHPHCHYRGLLRLHTCYGPPECSAAQGDLCREAPTRPVTQPSRSPASGFNRQLSGWNPPPLMIRAFRAHCQNETIGCDVDLDAKLVGAFVGASRRWSFL